MKKICKKELLNKLTNRKGFLFHIIGIAALIWFLIRIAPAPHRWQYPCQQISRTISFGYIAYWSALLVGITVWLKQTKLKTKLVMPAFLAIFIATGFMIGTLPIGNTTTSNQWSPIQNEPIGVPVGANPGRVAWVWNPDATQAELDGYWWQNQNNNQEIIDEMFSDGLQALSGEIDDSSAWNALFRYYNSEHDKGDIGYSEGEKIAIKINLNNGWESYSRQDNNRDASPQVVKALLRQLVNTLGVSQEDITVYDASRPMQDWFYYRVYYEEYPVAMPVAEFPEINFVDVEGGAEGRQQVTASSESIYFADGLIRTLPTCVTEADYIINMPLLKRHPIMNGVTLSGKNFFGTWIEPVENVHNYHEEGQTIGNPTPQTDLLAHESIGGKTLLYIGDGLYATKIDHSTIGKFTMYPFNNDWTNSLFFSQDPVAIDSVMYDFLLAEGTNPTEGSQNYLHQSAVPNTNTYDPENDGEYLSNSLGVHEHWNTSVSIFSNEVYSGPSNQGIDLVVIGEENAMPGIRFVYPKEDYLYIAGREITTFPITLIVGNMDIEIEINGNEGAVEKAEFYIDGELKTTIRTPPYIWTWNEKAFMNHIVKVIGYYNDNEIISEEMTVWKFF